MNPYEASQVKPELQMTKSSAASPATLFPTLTLAQLTTGQIATVRTLTGTDSISARLLEMGMIPGTTITLVGKAPLGDPLEFELRGYRLSLRKAEAQRVVIDVQN
jgi:ferrous iron transport protein A